MSEPRQETLSLIEMLVENSIGTTLPCNTEYIARGVDNYIDRMLEHEDHRLPEPTHQTVSDAITDSAGGDEPYSPHPYVQGMASEDY